MINYYELLGIESNISEEELYKLINNNIERLKKNDIDKNKKIYALAAISFLKRFKSTIENYGSKANYYIALRKIKDPFKTVRVKTTKMLENTKYKLIATSLATFTALGVTTALTGNDINVFTVEIPTYGEPVKQVCEELGINPWQLNLSDILRKNENNYLDNKNDGKLDVKMHIKTKELKEKRQEFNEKVSEFATKHKDEVFTYKVGKKDDIWKICDMYEVNIDDVIKVNENVDNIFSLQEGQIINIPHYNLGYNIKK